MNRFIINLKLLLLLPLLLLLLDTVEITLVGFLTIGVVALSTVLTANLAYII